jgi:signal transduction histidine kinase
MLRRRSIRLRIVVLVLVPVLGLLGLYAEVLNLTVGKILTLRQEAQIRELVALPVTTVQTQLASERGFALAYLARPSHAGLTLLLRQGTRTDQAIKNFNTTVQTALNNGPVPKEQQAFLTWQADLKRVDGLRSSVVSQGLSTIDAAGAYSTLLEAGDNVLSQAISPVLTGPLGIQATDLLTMARAAQALGEESDLVRADLLAGSFQPQDLTLVSQLAVLHQEEWAQTLPNLDAMLQDTFMADIPPSAAGQVASLESDLMSGPSGARNVSLRAWTSAEAAYRQGFRSALLKDMAALTDEANSQAKHLVTSLLLIAGIGLLAIVAAVVVGVILGRGLIRQLSELRQSAVRLSIEQLPTAISRLRAGHEVDVGAEVPQLAPGQDEIGQVSAAFNAAARTAIAAAVDEIKIRQGVNDVFRSLARRNQSLLTRQLQLLDTMERRVHDPEELADLFRVDHMTTRMRRHAEGLLIVAGGSSGRTWREPVPVVDVMRASAAEVEDYTRIRVNSRTSAALAGHAVADIIHLLAELLENATTFSPTNTPVRVDGDRVGRGVVVEIEDRGLGMSQRQLAEINATLVDPPLFDLSGSDQLGLFIAGQLAKRHGIKITLRSSAYGGVTAVVLIPTELVIDLPEADDDLAIAGIRELGGRPIPELPSAAAEPALTPSPGAPAVSGGQGRDGELDPRVPSGFPSVPVQPGKPSEPGVGPVAASLATGATVPLLPKRRGTTGLTWGETGILDGTWADRSATPAPATGAPGDEALADAGPAATRPAATGPAATGSATAAAARAEPGETMTGQADAAAADTAGQPARDASAAHAPAGLSELDGLPVRVPQANLAPQLLRADAPAPAAVGGEPTSGPSPEAARSTMAAVQLGWRRGRSMLARGDEPPEPLAVPAQRDDPPEPPAVPAQRDDPPEAPAVPAQADDRPEPPAVPARGDDPPEPPAVPARGDDAPERLAVPGQGDESLEPTAVLATDDQAEPAVGSELADEAFKTSPSPPRPGDQSDKGGSE